jgi:hypothetical protein
MRNLSRYIIGRQGRHETFDEITHSVNYICRLCLRNYTYTGRPNPLEYVSLNSFRNLNIMFMPRGRVHYRISFLFIEHTTVLTFCDVMLDDFNQKKSISCIVVTNSELVFSTSLDLYRLSKPTSKE